MANDKDALAEAKERFMEAQDAWAEVRSMALEDLRFARLGEQWPHEIARQRQMEGRPCLTINRLPTFIRQVVNDARQNKPTIRVRPVDNAADVVTADILNGIIRHIESVSDADVAYDTAIDCSVTQGLGFFYIDVDYANDSTFDTEIFIRRIANPQSVLFDPKSEAADSSDWRYAFVTDMMDRATFKRTYPGADLSDWQGGRDTGWFTDDQVRIAAYWSREETTRKILQLSNGEVVDAERFNKVKDLFAVGGITVLNERRVRANKVVHRIVSGADVLETTPWAGSYIPVVPVFGDEINVEGKRYFQSLVRHAKDSQRMFNYWRTTATELVALAPKAPWVGPETAFEVDGEAEKWATANTQSHAFLRYKGNVPPERQPFAGVPGGALQEAMNASDDIKAAIGMFDASLGAASNETSGRAIMARQREGDVGTFHFIDNLTRSIRCAGRILLDLIPQVYTGKRIVRILGEDGQAINVPIGQVTTLGGIQRVFDLSIGSYDVEVKSGPSFTSRREEAANQMIELVRAYPQAAPLLGDLLAKNLDWPDADKVAKRLQSTLPPQFQDSPPAPQGPPSPPPEVLAAQTMANAEIQSNREKLQAQLTMNREKIAAEAQMSREKLIAEATMKREAAVVSGANAAAHAQHLASMGRGTDTQIAHLAPGEIVVPPAAQTPYVMQALNQAFERVGVPLNQFRVGLPQNSINPRTGAPEFNFGTPYNNSAGPSEARNPNESQMVLNWGQRQFITPSMAEAAKSTLSGLTNNSFSGPEIDNIYDQVIRHIPLDDVKKFMAVDPSSYPITLDNQQYGIVNQEINNLSSDYRSRVMDEFRKSQENGRIAIPPPP